MAGGCHGSRGALAMRQLMPERISSSPGMAGLPPFISSSISCYEPGAFPRASVSPLNHPAYDCLYDVWLTKFDGSKKSPFRDRIVGLAAIAYAQALTIRGSMPMLPGWLCPASLDL